MFSAGRRRGALRLSSRERLMGEVEGKPDGVPLLPSALALPPRPSSCGRWQWMLRSQTKRAGLLFGGGRLFAPLAPCQKHVQSPALCLCESFVSAPSAEPLSPCPPFKCFFPRFCAPLSRLRGNEGAGRFPNFGRGKWCLPQLRAPQPAGVRQLFVRGGAGGAGPAAWAGGWGGKEGTRQEGRAPHPHPHLLCFAENSCFFFPFYPLKRGGGRECESFDTVGVKRRNFFFL